MPRFQIDYTQPVHVSYRAIVEAEDALDAIKKLLAVLGPDAERHDLTHEQQQTLAKLSDGIDYDDSVSDVIWDAMEPLEMRFLNSIEETDDAQEDTAAA